MDYNLDDVIDELETLAKDALKDGGTSNWGHRTLQVVEWLKELKKSRKMQNKLIEDLENLENNLTDDFGPKFTVQFVIKMIKDYKKEIEE